jgi:hypothetical protein
VQISLPALIDSDHFFLFSEESTRIMDGLCEGAATRVGRPASFVHNTFAMLQDARNAGAVRWGRNGASIVVTQVCSGTSPRDSLLLCPYGGHCGSSTSASSCAADCRDWGPATLLAVLSSRAPRDPTSTGPYAAWWLQ